MNSLKNHLPIAFDPASHHALGGGSYVFKSEYPAYLKSLLPHPGARTEINIIIQPNSSPHIGTLCSLGLSFVLARRLKDLGVDTAVVCDLWDRVKGVQVEINGVAYQKSLSWVGKFQSNLLLYRELLDSLSERYGVEHNLRLEKEFLSQENMPAVIHEIISRRSELSAILAPERGTLALRAECPSCGLVDKYGVNNEYADDNSSVSFACPHHGRFELRVASDDVARFQFNCQLFNLVLGRFYEQASYNWIEVCGSDYAGFWQEQLLWRFLSKPALIVYTPLISDWSGSKISKSMYLQRAAYDYLRRAGQEYLLSYQVLKREGKDLGVLWREVELWVDEPYRLFRGYSIHYVHLLFQRTRLGLGVTHQQVKAPETE